MAIEGVYGVRVPFISWLGFALLCCKLSEMSSSDKDANAISYLSEFEDELTKAVQTITAHFLSNRRNLSSDTIVDVASPSQVTTIRELAIPQSHPQPLQSAIKSATQIFAHRIRNEHPRFFGFIPSPVSPVAWIADAVTTAFNVHAGSWFQSSGPSAVEDSLCRWLATQAGFPAGEGTGGVFVSGGSIANLTGLMLARDQKLKFEERARGVAYVSDQTHASVAKGLRILGFRNEQIRKVQSDERFRMDVAALIEAVRKDKEDELLPFLVVATCGTTNTGSVDPMDEIADFAQSQNMWMHVDGAYGASVALSKSHRSLLRGVGRADSVSWDAHKWLFLTYGCGMLIVREKRLLVESFVSNAEYIQDAAEAATHNPNFWNMSMELTRPARAMRLWFTLHVLGLDKVGQMIDHGFVLAEVAEAELRMLPGWEIVAPPGMAIVNFRFAPEATSSEELDKLNSDISKRAVEENLAAPLTTKIRGVTVMRICAISPELGKNEMRKVVHGLDRIARSFCTSNQITQK